MSVLANARERPTGLDAAALAARWDDGVAAAGGGLLQSWRWGEFKSRHGWDVARVQATLGGQTAFAQILFKRRGPLSMGYIPRGPVVPGNRADLYAVLMKQIDAACRRKRAISVIVESEREAPPEIVSRFHLAPGPAHIQPVRTVIVPLLDDEPLLMQMHQKTRYNIRLAARKGVQVTNEREQPGGFAAFYSLMQDTSERNEFGIHSAAYYQDVLDTFPDSCALLVARDQQGEAGSAVLVAGFGDHASYLYGASSTRLRSLGPGFPVQYEAMRWARDRGFKDYDLWGIPAQDPGDTSVADGSRIAGTRGDDWRGLYEFKVRFGGQIVSFPPPLERSYVPVLPKLARRLYSPDS